MRQTTAGVAHDVTTVEPDELGAPWARSLSVVIPAYNEQDLLADTVARTLDALRAMDLDFFEVIVCENGSTDGTRALAYEISRNEEDVTLIALDEPDYGAAMRAGFLAARGDAIANFDADYYDFDFVTKALRVDADIVVAAKGILGSQDARVLTRRAASKTFGAFVRTMLEVEVTETHGIKVFRRDAIAAFLPYIVSTKDLFDTELLARCEWTGLPIRELPIRTQEMRHSRSGLLRRIPRTVWGLVKMRYRLRGSRLARIPGRAERAMDVAA